MAASKLDSTFWKTDHLLRRSGAPAWRLRLELKVGRDPEEIVAKALIEQGSDAEQPDLTSANLTVRAATSSQDRLPVRKENRP